VDALPLVVLEVLLVLLLLLPPLLLPPPEVDGVVDARSGVVVGVVVLTSWTVWLSATVSGAFGVGCEATGGIRL